MQKNKNMSSNDLLKLATLQNDIDNIYAQKARGAFVRSRRKWMEAGGKNNKYYLFFKFRKKEIGK